MTEQKPEAPLPDSGAPKQRPLRRWLKRLAKWGGAALGLLLLLVLLLPWLLSTLPVDRWASGFASNMVPGTIRIEGIRLAWFSGPIRIDRVLLEDETRTGPGRRFLSVEGIEISRSLRQLIFTKDRLGTVSVKAIDLDAVRAADGTFNFTAYIPPTDPNAPPEPPAKPFELDLDKLIPEVPIPLPQLNIQAPQIDVKFTDLAASPTLNLGFRDGRFSTVWKGGTAPLQMVLKGDVRGTTESFPIEADVVLSDWIGADGTTTLRRLVLDAAATVAGKPAGTVDTKIRDGGVAWTTNIPLGPWVELARVHPAGGALPGVRGSLAVAGVMKPDGDTQVIGNGIKVEGLALDGLGTRKATLAVPDIALYAGARLHKRTFDRDDVELTIDSKLFHFALNEDTNGTTGALPNRLLTADASLRTEDLIAFTREAALASGTIPEVDGSFGLKASVLHHDTSVESGTITLAWTGRRALLPADVPFPAAVKPRDSEIDLRPTSFRFQAVARPKANGLAQGDFRLENALLPFSGTFDTTAPNEGVYTIASNLSLARVMEFVDSEFVLEPTVAMAGDLAFATNVSVSGDKVAHDGSFTANGLSFSTSAVPDFTYQDNLALKWKGDAELAPVVGAGIDLSFGSEYTTATLAADYRGSVLKSFHTEGAVQLGEIATRIVPAFAPDLPATIAGAVAFSATANEEPAKTYHFETALASSPEFNVASSQFQMGLNAFSTHLKGETTLLADGLNFRADEAVLSLEDFAEARFSGSVTKSGELVTFEGKPMLTVQYDTLLAKAAAYLADGFAMTVEAAGTTTFDSSVAAQVRMAPEGMQYPKPVDFSATLTTDIEALQWQAPDMGMSASVTALKDVRRWKASADPSAPMDVAFREENESAVGSLNFTMDAVTPTGNSHKEVTIGDVALAMATELAPGRKVAWKLARLDAGSIVTALASDGAEPMKITVPAFASKADFEADVPAQHFDLKSFDVKAGDLMMTSGSLVVDMKNLDEAATRREIAVALRTGFAAPDFGRIPAMTEPNLADSFVSDLAGALSSQIDARINLTQSPDGVVPNNYDGNVQVDYSGVALTMPGVVKLKTASGQFSLEGAQNRARIDTNNEFSIRLLNQPNLPDLDSMRIFSQMELAESGDFSIDNLAFSSDQLGTIANLRGTLRNAAGTMKSFSEAKADTTPLDMALAIPMELFFTFDQQMPPLEQTGFVKESSGTLTLQSRLVNLPNSKTEIQFDQTASEVGFRYGELVELRGIRGKMPFLQPLFHKPVAPPPAVYGEGEYHIDLIHVTMPPYDLNIRHLNTQIVAETGRYRVVSRSPDLFGGSFEFNGRLTANQGDPQFNGNFGLTGLDAGVFLPNLTRGLVEKREIDTFGSLVVRLPKNPTLTSVFEETTLRMEVAEMGPEVMRGALRKMDQAGGSPGIQAALGALRFSRPGASRFDIQGGLMSASVEMVSPGNIRYSIPLLENASVANLLGAYGKPEYEQQIVLLREGLVILLAGNMQPVRQFLASRATPP